MYAAIKELLRGKKSEFNKFCQIYDLEISYDDNKTGFGILQSVFQQREYADWFPFYEKVNILDVGAHFGFFSIFASKNSHPESQIYAVEPASYNFSRILQNTLSCNVNNVNAFNIALGAQNSLVKLYLSASENNTIIDNYVPDISQMKSELIEMKTLETVFTENNIDVIHFCKMDCEGAEYQIIQSTPKYILDKIETLSIEFHDYKHIDYSVYDLLNKLKVVGFSIVKFDFSPTNQNLNYGKIVATKRLNAVT